MTVRRHVHRDACWSCGQGLFVVLRLRSLEVSASSVIYGRVCCALHDALHLLDHLTYQPGACYLASPARSSSEAQEDRARFSSSRVKPSASLFLIAVTEDPVSSLSSLQPDLLGGSELLYLLPVFGARFPPQSTVR
ncbi:hypothetical protein HID58_018308 [Brassica napus]|nr:hypothetical protein HID58_018308 [Brassica napus]